MADWNKAERGKFFTGGPKDRFHVSEIATFDPDVFPKMRHLERANVRRYNNLAGKQNDIADLVTENGEVLGCVVSTNVKDGRGE